MKIKKFPKIGALRSVIKEVTHRTRFIGMEDDQPKYNTTAELPTLTFRGSVKLHGTNGGVVWHWNPLTFSYERVEQSRERIITPSNDNQGFSTFVHTSNFDVILPMIMKNCGDLGYTPQRVAVFGEWCGGNIQKGVALNGLDKMFVIFAIKIDEVWLSDDVLSKVKSNENKIYNILDFPTYTIDIDFNSPKDSAEVMAEYVEKIEKECPVGKHFGNSGVGEGLVWICVTEGWSESRFWFKTKGDEHKSSSSKEKVPVDIEKVENIKKLVETFLTESRLNQGIEYLKQMNLELSWKSTGAYVKWVSNDVISEELDTIVGNGFKPKEITKTISTIARKWLFNYLDESVGL